MFNFVDMLELKDLTDDILALFVSLHKLEYIKQLGGGGGGCITMIQKENVI